MSFYSGWIEISTSPTAICFAWFMIRSHHVCQSAALWRRLFRSPRLVAGSLWFFQSAHSHCRFHSLIKDSPHVFFQQVQSKSYVWGSAFSHYIVYWCVYNLLLLHGHSLQIDLRHILSFTVYKLSQQRGFGFFPLLWTEIVVIYRNKLDLNIQRRENDDKDLQRQRFRQTNNEKKKWIRRHSKYNGMKQTISSTSANYFWSYTFILVYFSLFLLKVFSLPKMLCFY